VTAFILDTGPLFAYLSENDAHHGWAVRQFAAIQGALLTCEPVLAEVSFLISSRGAGLEGFWSFLRRGVIRVNFRLGAEFESVAVLMRRYADLSMDLADACLVRLAEQNQDCRVLTTDSDFRIYRRFGRQTIPLVIPN
jgi:uncharacterized protein